MDSAFYSNLAMRPYAECIRIGECNFSNIFSYNTYSHYAHIPNSLLSPKVLNKSWAFAIVLINKEQREAFVLDLTRMGSNWLHRRGENRSVRESVSSDQKKRERWNLKWLGLAFSRNDVSLFVHKYILVSRIRKSTTTGMTYRSSKSRWKAIINA